MLYRPYQSVDSVDRTFIWRVLADFGVPQNILSAIRQFHDGMQACVRLDDRVCSGWFAVERSLRQGYMLALLLFNTFFALVISVAYMGFKAEKDIMDALVHLRGKSGRGGRGGGNRRRATPDDVPLGMPYADDARVVSHSPEHLRKVMGVIVVVCVAFGLTVSEAKTEIMCLRTKRMP